MITKTVCKQFGVSGIQSCQPLSNGLINHSYKVESDDGSSYFFQQINTAVFKNPLALQNNYLLIEKHLLHQQVLTLPKLITTTNGELLYRHETEAWRCFTFVPGTFSPLTVDTPEQAYEVANCFGTFTASLHELNTKNLQTVIPGFHDLSFRYQEFQMALQKASPDYMDSVADLIQQVEKHSYLTDWFQQIASDKQAFPLHVMHHDCKVSNILFDELTRAVRCPIDLDTTQPGLFFSDLGDMIRTMAPDKSENETGVIGLRTDFFKAVIEGYTDAMTGCFTKEEEENLHKSGLVMTYMQAMRFLTDYLNGSVYYKIEYAEQNKDRTTNQLQLLHLLKAHTEAVVV